MQSYHTAGFCLLTWNKPSYVLDNHRHTSPQHTITTTTTTAAAAPSSTNNQPLLLLLLLPAAVLHKLQQRPNVAEPCLLHPADV
jgi:hypothetical protein